MSKISILSLGCPKNLVDSDTLMDSLGKEGFLFTNDPREAEFMLVNTCGFIEDAKRESIGEILRLKEIKNRNRKLLVFGCLAKRYGEELRKEIPEIDALWGVSEEDKIVEYCKKLKASSKQHEASSEERVYSAYSLPPAQNSYAYLKISEGCGRGCTYCVIPSIRGPYRSVEPDSVLRKAEGHLKSGVRELVLVAQDLGNYGREFKGYTLSSLIRDITSISGDFRVRLLYVNPSSVNEELLSAVSEKEKVCKYLDIPLQHSEGRILRAMGRGGTRKSNADLIKRVRGAVPDVALRTTFIVGFPGETEEDFSGLRDFVEDVRFENLGVFKYSREEGTPAAKMKGNVPARIKEKRRDEIMRLQSAISLEKNKALIGRRFRVLIDEVDGETAVARLSSQAPEIDGVVIIKNCVPSGTKSETCPCVRRVRNPKPEALKAGEFVDVVITGAYDYDLKGELAE